jgi:ribosomal protein L37AE/L43A
VTDQNITPRCPICLRVSTVSRNTKLGKVWTCEKCGPFADPSDQGPVTLSGTEKRLVPQCEEED